MNGVKAPHCEKSWPRSLWWLCALLGGHKDRNYSDGVIHYAYCLRCGRLFGGLWGGGRDADGLELNGAACGAAHDKWRELNPKSALVPVGDINACVAAYLSHRFNANNRS